MTVDEAIRARRTAHAYQPVPVDPAVVTRALEAAHRAPCHKHTWPWRFLRVGPETQGRLYDLAVAMKEGDGPPQERVRTVIREKFGNPGALVVVTVVRGADPLRGKENYAATCCALQNMVLSLTASGLSTKWSTGKITRLPAVHALLEIDIDAEDIVGFVWIGTPLRVPDVDRPALSMHIRELP